MEKPNISQKSKNFPPSLAIVTSHSLNDDYLVSLEKDFHAIDHHKRLNDSYSNAIVTDGIFCTLSRPKESKETKNKATGNKPFKFKSNKEYDLQSIHSKASDNRHVPSVKFTKKSGDQKAAKPQSCTTIHRNGSASNKWSGKHGKSMPTRKLMSPRKKFGRK